MTALRLFDSPREAAEACGAAILEALDAARSERGRARLAVSGGTTPRIMFEWMARQAFDWSRVDLFWVDERCVPIDDAQSNYRMTRESLLDAIGGAAIGGAAIHRVRTEFPPEEAARLYVEEIRASFGLRPGELPEFDVVQRGMGPDKHTASLFPGEPLIENETDIAAAVWVEKFGQHRVTLLPGVLKNARATYNLVTGADKAVALREVFSGDSSALESPAKIASPGTIWFVDGAAFPAGLP